MKSQIEFLKKAIKLKNENPEMDIHFCACSDELLNDFAWTAHLISKIEINPWLQDDERIYIDEDEIKEYYKDLHADDNITDDELNILIDNLYKENVKDAICIYTNAG